MAPRPNLIALTGGAGEIATAIRPRLAELAKSMRSIDTRPIHDPAPNEDIVLADVRLLEETVAALEGADVVVHLAAIPFEASFEEILRANIEGTYHVLEAARRAGTKRVIYASSIHATGFYPLAYRVGPDDPVRPDTYYGTSKVFGEALARLYVDKLGMEAVCLRIIGFKKEPVAPEYLWGWLSPRDAIHLFERSVLAEPISFLTVYGVSNNSRRRVSDQGWDVLGYRPLDDAETFADRFMDQASPFTLHGIDFALSGLPPTTDLMP